MKQPISDTGCTSEVVRYLRRPQHYPETMRRVEVIETHFSWIFLTDRYAYKLKKPVRRGSMDYRTIAARLGHRDGK